MTVNVEGEVSWGILLVLPSDSQVRVRAKGVYQDFLMVMDIEVRFRI